MDKKQLVRQIMKKRKKWRSHEVLSELRKNDVWMSGSSLERNYFRAMNDVTCKQSPAKPLPIGATPKQKAMNKPKWWYSLKEAV